MRHSPLKTHPALDVALSRIRSLRPTDFELYFLRTQKTSVEAKDGKVETLTRAEDVGLSVRVIHHQRQGFSFTTSLERTAIERAVESAIEIASHMPEDPWMNLKKLKGVQYPTDSSIDEAGLSKSIEEKKKLAVELERQCRSQDRRITGVRSAGFSESIAEACLVDSENTRIETREALFSSSILCKAEQDGDSQMGGDFDFNHELSKLNIESVAQNGARFATELLGATSPPTLQCQAIFRNSVVAELLDFLSASFSAENVDKGRSLLAGKDGNKIFSSCVTITDDGTLAGGYATSPFDAEGVPSRKNIIVEKGTFQGPLYDLYYGKKLGRPASGVSSRGIKSPPKIGFTNLSIEKGNRSFSNLVQSIRGKGILITDLMGIHTANPVTGDFSLGASGILIEDGQLTQPVKGFAVAGNLLELLNRITDIGEDHRFFGNVGAPSVLISEISVGGS